MNTWPKYPVIFEINTWVWLNGYCNDKKLYDRMEHGDAENVRQLPGARLLHEGQFEGSKVRLPVFLGRRPDDRSGDEMRDAGMYVDLKPWQCHLFEGNAV